MKHAVRHGKPGRFMAALLSLSMIFSMFGGVSGLNSVSVANAAQGNGSTEGATQGVRLRQADPSTMDDYKDVLNLASPSDGSRYAGRLWSDKSVFAISYDDEGDRKDQWTDGKLTLTKEKDGVEENGVNNVIDATDADFLHVYSVLGSSERIEENIPVDLIISIDITSSMLTGGDTSDRGNWENSIQKNSNLAKVLNAANTLMESVREYSDKSRISVVVYWGTAYQMIPFVDGSVEFTGYSVRHDFEPSNKSNAEAVIHYKITNATKEECNGNYVYDPVFGDHYKYSENSTVPKTDTYIHDEADKPEERLKCEVGGVSVEKTGKDSAADLEGGTCTEAGVYTALKALADMGIEGHTYLTDDGQEGTRIPVAVILGDGDTNHTLVKKGDSDAGSEDSTATTSTVSPDWWDVYTGQNGHMQSAKSAASSGTAPKKHEKSAVIGGVLQGAFWRAAVANAYEVSDIDNVQVYTIGIAKRNAETYPVLDPNTWFGDGKSLANYNTTVKNWYSDSSTKIIIEDKNTEDGYKGNPSSLGRKNVIYEYVAPTEEKLGPNYSKYEVQLNQLDLVYTKQYYQAEEDLAGTFKDVFSQITQNMSAPVAGTNDLGAEGSVTYMDPMGKYMEVKDVKNLVLFGKNYPVKKAAVFNNSIVSGISSFQNGWYKIDKNGRCVGYDYNLSPENQWKEENGSQWVYLVDKRTTEKFVPTILSDSEEKIQNTTYTIYQIDVEDAEFIKLHMNPAYVTETDNTKQETELVSNFRYDGEEQEHLENPGVFALADIRIWVEDTRSYNDDLGEALTSTGYDEALWVDVPANAVPLRTATISNDANKITYETNIGGKKVTTGDISWNTAVAQQDKPLRVFYTVGVHDEMLTESGEIDLSKVSARYLNKYRVTAETAEKRGLLAGYVEFLSNWYDDTSTYDYNGSEASMTFGDPVVSFSPSEANRYYVFQDAIPLYSIPDPSKIKDEVRQKGVHIGDPLGGTLTEHEIQGSLAFAGFSGAALVEDISGMSSDSWYFAIVQYYVPTEGGNGKIQYTAIPRKGSEFGSGVGEGRIGAYLCWYDAGVGSETFMQTRAFLKEDGGIQDKPTEGGNKSRWVIAARKGGLRSGVLSRNVKDKGKKGNVTRTSDNYYVPTISSSTNEDVGPDGMNSGINVDVYLGNNGRIAVIQAKTELSPGEGENVGVGSEIEYKIHWEGDATKKSFVKVVDPLDKGVDFVSAAFDDKISDVKITAASPQVGGIATVEGTATVGGTQIPVTISYNSASRTVTWEIGTENENGEKVPAKAGGDVLLTVKVNKNAIKKWDYNDGEDSGTDGEDDDYDVKNRARIEVNNNSYFTNTVENPTNEKTEVTPGDGEPVGVGDPIEYSIHWENDRGQDSIVTVTDPLDIGVDFVSASYGNGDIKITADNPSNNGTVKFSPYEETPVFISYDSETHTVTWTIGNDEYKVPATVRDNVSLNVKVNEKAIQKWTYDPEKNQGQSGDENDYEVLNRAHIQVGDHGSYTNTVENPTPHNGKEEVDPHEGDLVGIGQEITYEISWHNHEPEPVNIDIIDVLDPGVDFVSASEGGEYRAAMGVTYQNGEFYSFQHLVVWHLGEQPAGASGKVTLTVKVNAKAVEKYTYDGDASALEPGEGKDYEVFNQAKVKVGNNPFVNTDIVENPVPDKDETNIKHEDTNNSNPELPPKTDGGEGKDGDYTVTGPQVYVGDEITYTIHWANHEKNSAGEYVEAEVVITDPLDPGVDFVSADNDGVYDSETHTVTWSFTAGPDDGGDVELVVRVNDKALPVGTVQNQAQVQVGDDPAVDTKIIENPTPKVEKTEVSPGEGMQVMPGDEIEYEISWHNYDTSREYADVTITDKLDPGVDFVSASFGDINISSSDSSDSGKLPTEADLTVILDGEEDIQDEFPFTLKLTAPKTPEEPGAPEGRPLEKSYSCTKKGSDGKETAYTGTWEADDKESKFSFELKTGESLTVEDLPVGTVYTLEHTLEQGSQTITKGSKLGVFGSSVLVHVEPQTKPVSSGGQAGTSREPRVSTSGNANKKVIPDQKAEEPAVKRNVAPRWNTGLRFGIPALSTPSDASENRLPQAQAGYPAATVPNAAGQGRLPEQEQPEYPVATPSDPTELTDLYEFSLISIEDLPAPAAAPEEEEDGGEGEEAIMTYTGEDRFGEVTIEYFADSHMVKWFLERRPANSSGVVRLTVRVNEDAEKFWSYDEPDAGPSDTVKDERVRNQAGVRVGNNPEVKTQIVENPTEPEKRETEIEDKDVSRDLEVDWDEDEEGGLDDFIGPEVHVGDTITYTVTWQNNAKDNNNNGEPVESWVVVIDTLDDGVDYENAGVEKIVPDNLPQPRIDYHSDGGVLSPPEGYDPIEIPARSVVWDFGVLPPRATGRVTLKVRVNEKALPAAGTTEGEVVNSAEVTVGNETAVTNQVTNPVGGPRKTEIRPGDGEPVQIGDQIDYEITWRNYKSESARVVVMDTLDPGVDFVSATNGGQYYAETGETLVFYDGTPGIPIPAHTVVWVLDNQPAGTEGTVSLRVKVNNKATLDYTYNEQTGVFDVGTGTDDRVYNRARVKVGNDDFQYTETPENPVEPPDNPPSNPPDNPPRVPTEPYTPTEPEVPPTEPEAPTVENRETPPQQLTKLPDAEPEQSVPYTGDDRHPGFWLAVMGLSMAAAWFSFWQIRKIVRSEKVPGRSRRRRRRW